MTAQEFALEFAQNALALAIDRCEKAGVTISRLEPESKKDWKRRRQIIKGAIANMIEQELKDGRLVLVDKPPMIDVDYTPVLKAVGRLYEDWCAERDTIPATESLVNAWDKMLA